MRRRVVELVGPRAERMWVSTFHSACLRILRSHADRLGYQSSFTIYDDTDSRRLIEIIVADSGSTPSTSRPGRWLPSSARPRPSWSTPRRSERSSSGRTRSERRIADVYAEYQRRLLAANAMDFDDLLMQAVRLLADLRRRAGRLPGALPLRPGRRVPGHQPGPERAGAPARPATTATSAWSATRDQSVYRWRGADIRNILEFEEAFPDATTVLLEQNYRSTQTILDAANAVIANNTVPAAEAPVHRGRGRRPDLPLPGRGRARRGEPGWPARS